MIRIETQHLQEYYRRDIETALRRGDTTARDIAEWNLVDVCARAGKLFFYPTATAEVYFRSPLPALPAVTESTVNETFWNLRNCECERLDCACWQNAYTANQLVRGFVDRDGLTAID